MACGFKIFPQNISKHKILMNTQTQDKKKKETLELLV